MLPIGGKTRVVTFGELEEFPGRETIVMTQTVPDFELLKNKYRHEYDQIRTARPKAFRSEITGLVARSGGNTTAVWPSCPSMMATSAIA